MAAVEEDDIMVCLILNFILTKRLNGEYRVVEAHSIALIGFIAPSNDSSVTELNCKANCLLIALSVVIFKQLNLSVGQISQIVEVTKRPRKRPLKNELMCLRAKVNTSHVSY